MQLAPGTMSSLLFSILHFLSNMLSKEGRKKDRKSFVLSIRKSKSTPTPTPTSLSLYTLYAI